MAITTLFNNISTSDFDKRLAQITEYLEDGNYLFLNFNPISKDDIDDIKDPLIKDYLNRYNKRLTKSLKKANGIPIIFPVLSISHSYTSTTDIDFKFETTINDNTSSILMVNTIHLYDFLNIFHYRLQRNDGLIMPEYTGYLIKG